MPPCLGGQKRYYSLPLNADLKSPSKISSSCLFPTFANSISPEEVSQNISLKA